MEIREATEADIPDIVSLLKLSLGESFTPKSERYWRWKHLESPFGKSIVLLCWQGTQLIGVRAFMRWEWVLKGQIIKTVRAVDTATHPDHQRKGIFKNLNLRLIDLSVSDNIQFVFNTPNQYTRSGNLNLGWIEAGRFPVNINIGNPVKILRNVVFKSRTSQTQLKRDYLSSYFNHPTISSLLKQYQRQMPFLTTNISVPYLNWRYYQVPVAKYVAIGQIQDDYLTSLIVGRIKATRLGNEFRITDFLCDSERNDNATLKTQLKQQKKEWGIDYTTFSGTHESKNVLFGLHSKLSVGPIVTIKALNSTNVTSLKNFNQWSPSLGDLELF